MLSGVAVGLGALGVLLAVIALVEASGAKTRARRLEREIETLKLAIARGDAAPAIAPVEAPARAEAAADALDVATAVADLAEAPVLKSQPAAPPQSAGSPAASGPGRPVEPPRSVETTIGLTWATRVGAALFVAGVLFFFKYAVDRDWLGPWTRVGLGGFAGALCLGLSYRLRHTVSSAWTHVLAGIGLAILLGAAWAAHALYGLVPSGVAFVAYAGLVVLGGGWATVLKSEPLLVTATLAGFANPILLDTALSSGLPLFAYLNVVAAGGLVVATRSRWVYAIQAVVVGGLALAGWWLVSGYGDADLVLPAADQAWPLVGMALLSAQLVITATRWPTGAIRLGALTAAAVVIVISAAGVCGPGVTLGGAAGAVLAAIGLGAWRVREDIGTASVTAMSIAMAALLVRALSGPATSGAALITVALWCAVLLVDAVRALVAAPAGAKTSLTAQLGLAGPLFIAASVHSYGLDASMALALVAGLTLLAHVAAGVVLRRAERPRSAAIAWGVALGCVAFLVPVMADGSGITALWAALAAATAAVAVLARLPRLTRVAGVVLFMAFIHLLVVDFDTFALSRARPGLIAIGAALLILAWAIEQRGPRVVERIPAGLLLRALGLIALGSWWILEARHLAAGSDAIRVITTAAVAGFGAVVLVTGFASRHVHYRWLGLLTLTGTVVKLVTFDLWRLDLGWRTFVLIGFGALLLLSGFLYARFGARLREILVDDEDP